MPGKAVFRARKFDENALSFENIFFQSENWENILKIKNYALKNISSN